jgi:hypothetical protein
VQADLIATCTGPDPHKSAPGAYRLGRNLLESFPRTVALPEGCFVHSVKVKLQLDNVLDRKVQITSAVGATPASNAHNALPTMSYFRTVSTEF